MKKLLKFVFPLMFVTVVAAMPQEPAKKPSDALQVKIVRIQKHQSDLQVKAQAAQSQISTLTADYTQSNKELQDLVDEAYKEAGLKKEEYDLNPETLEFTKKVVPPPANNQNTSDPKASKDKKPK